PAVQLGLTAALGDVDGERDHAMQPVLRTEQRHEVRLIEGALPLDDLREGLAGERALEGGQHRRRAAKYVQQRLTDDFVRRHAERLESAALGERDPRAPVRREQENRRILEER